MVKGPGLRAPSSTSAAQDGATVHEITQRTRRNVSRAVVARSGSTFDIGRVPKGCGNVDLPYCRGSVRRMRYDTFILDSGAINHPITHVPPHSFRRTSHVLGRCSKTITSVSPRPANRQI